MITKQEIESLGWKHYATASNGGSMQFQKNKIYSLQYNGENLIFKRKNDAQLKEIAISKVENKEFVPLYKGKPKNIEELKKVLSKLKINEI